MGTYLRLPQKHRFNAWLSGLAPEEVWKRTAADIATEASDALGFTVTANVVSYARRCLVPKPPQEPGLAERVDALEANHESLRGWSTMRLQEMQLGVDGMRNRLAELERALHDHEQLSPPVSAG